MVTYQEEAIRVRESMDHQRRWYNRQVRRMQEERGINVEKSDLSIGVAMKVIAALKNVPTRVFTDNPSADQLAMAMAEWHPSCELKQYLNKKSPEYIRDFDQSGVYILFELTPNGYVPLLVEAVPRYVGMSSMLHNRLWMHINGRSSNPAEHVLEEYLVQHPEARKNYENLSPWEKQKMRARLMRERGFYVRTAHTSDLLEARRLEKAMIRLYDRQGFDLWNKILYKTTPPFPNI